MTPPTAAQGRVETAVTRVIEALAGCALAAEILVVAASVFARYVLHAPFTWSDEMSTVLFLWLGMLGAVLALRRRQHMRMTAVLDGAEGGVRAGLEHFGAVVAFLFLALAFPPAVAFAVHEADIVTPALEMSGAWGAAAVPVGLGLMLAFSVLHLLRSASPRLLAGLAIGLVAAGVLLIAARPLFAELGQLNLLIFFVLFGAAGVFLGAPIAFVFGLAAVAYIGLTTDAPISVVAGRINEGMSHLILLAVPLFVFLGLLIEMTGMARAMVAFLGALLGHIPGGLSYVLVGAMVLVSGISGSKAADMAAIAPALLPEMKKRGARPGDLVALLAATGAQTETIPPSLVLITIGSVTSVSMAALFTGGLVPALVAGLLLCGVIGWRARRTPMVVMERPTPRQIGIGFLVALPALALPFIVRAAVVEGVATATEASTIGIVYAVLAGLLVYRQFPWRRLGRMLVDTAALSGAILFIIGAATAVAWCLTQSGFSADLAEAMQKLPGGAPTFLLASIVAFVILGSVLEGIPALVLFAPLVFPIARSLGIHEVHYAMVVVLAMGLGLFMPPFGVGYYTACAIGQAEPKEAMRPLLGYAAALLLAIAIVAAFPWLSIGFL